MLFQTMKITLNGIPNIRDGFIPGLALGNATREHRTFHHKHTILVGLEHDSKFHGSTLAAKGASRNGETKPEMRTEHRLVRSIHCPELGLNSQRWREAE
jgi:hypothetical protein